MATLLAAVAGILEGFCGRVGSLFSSLSLAILRWSSLPAFLWSLKSMRSVRRVYIRSEAGGHVHEYASLTHE